MLEQKYKTNCGDIHYWVDGIAEQTEPQLVFLPGLTADHRLFEMQIAHFEGKYPVFVWDAPGHGSLWPFQFDFNLMDKAKWLDEILKIEGFEEPIIVGHSMGGYVAQAYAQLFPDKLSGLISLDSTPLWRKYVTNSELWLLKRMEPVYRYSPWQFLMETGTNSAATSQYGRQLMHDIMMVYDGNQDRYARLFGHGFRILAEAIEANLPYEITCPALLICGKKDLIVSCVLYNKTWHEWTGIPIEWIEHAGHNSNTDAPEIVNSLIEKLISSM